MGYNLVMRVGRNRDGLRPECMPEFHHRVGRGGIRPRQRRDKAGTLVKQTGTGVIPAGFLRASDRVRTDEVRAWSESCVREAADFTLHAAYVGHERAGRQVRREVAREPGNFIHRCGEHDKRGSSDSRRWSVSDDVAPRLAAQGEPSLGPARPKRDPPRETTRARRLGDGAAKQSRGEDDEIFQHV